MSLLNKFENKYIIKGCLIAESPIHIGTGPEDFSPTAVDNGVIRDENGNPFIPGSSLKGVLRSFMERIIPAIYPKEYTACDILGESCTDDNFLKVLKKKNLGDKKMAEEIYKNECDVCRLFGGKAFSSKLQISDCRLIGKKAYTQKRDGVAIDRDTLTAANGKKYDFECVAVGTKFNFEMTIHNLDENQKQLVRIIISFLENGELKVGGKTSSGFGNIKLENKEIYMIDKNNVKEFYLGDFENNKEKFKGDL